MLSINVHANLGAFKLRAQLPPIRGVTVVIGPNGAGKSSLFLSVLGAIKPLRGAISLGAQTLFCAQDKINVPMEQRRLGYLPQRYALFPHMTVAQNIGFGIRDCHGSERAARVAHLLQDLEIEHIAQRKTSVLSGGEAQRVALARALAIKPHALLLDEPMAALDAGTRRSVRRFLAARLAAVAVPTLIISHDIEDVESLAKQIAVLEAGAVVQSGTLTELRAAPATDFVRDFVAGSATTSTVK